MSIASVRLLVSAVVGIVVGVGSGVVAPWQLALLAGWIAAAVVFLAAVWSTIRRADGADTQRTSTAEDDSRTVRGLIVVGASVASLGGAAAALQKAGELDGAPAALLTASALTTIVVSWLGVHTDYTLRYAHLYYSPPVGGVSFPGVDLPDYRDFAYLAFTIGMTYQVSDTGLLGVRFRRVLLSHAFVSYLFGAVIIASAINVVARIME